VSAEPLTGVKSDHYSYTVYADPAMAEAFDRARFGGPIGELLAESQAAVLRDFAGGQLAGQSALDVGTGTARAALLLADAGADVTALDASSEMLRVARTRAASRGVAIRFEVGDAHHLAHTNRSFDLVVSLRVLMHTPNWRQCIAEFCRVARHRVIVDFPALGSVAALQAAARRTAAAAGAQVEAYRVFREAQIRGELGRHGFRVTRTHRQFVLPIALHKRLGSRRLTERLEGGLAMVGLLTAAGSPVTVLAER
jgi:2-polyprenyl-3-methyl-5-hydroxy-6-metoxy-1,4-benzoquinol methylase